MTSFTNVINAFHKTVMAAAFGQDSANALHEIEEKCRADFVIAWDRAKVFPGFSDALDKFDLQDGCDFETFCENDEETVEQRCFKLTSPNWESDEEMFHVACDIFEMRDPSTAIIAMDSFVNFILAREKIEIVGRELGDW